MGFPIKHGDFPVRYVMKPVEPPRDSHENQLQPCHAHAHAPSAVRLAQPTAVRCCEGCGAEALRGGLRAIIEADWSWHVLITFQFFLLVLLCSSVLVIICEVSGLLLMLILMLLPLLMMTTMTRMIDVAIPPRHLKNGPMLPSRWPVTAECFAAVSVSGKELKEVRLWKK